MVMGVRQEEEEEKTRTPEETFEPNLESLSLPMLRRIIDRFAEGFYDYICTRDGRQPDKQHWTFSEEPGTEAWKAEAKGKLKSLSIDPVTWMVIHKHESYDERADRNLGICDED